MLLVSVLTIPETLGAQGIMTGVSGIVARTGRTQYGVAWLSPRLGPVEVSIGATLLAGADGTRTGGQVDVDLGRGGGSRWYAVGGMAGGLGSRGAESPWGGWSAGLGFRLLVLGASDLGLEARYLHLWRPSDGLVLGGRLALRFGGRPAGRPAPSVPGEPGPPPLAVATPAGGSALRTPIVQAAVDAMGRPYAWGGTDANGFDCSGLIQYAYARHGIALPRRSADQARAGRLVPPDPAQLLPGDILTFGSSPGGPVTHVGLYLGEGQFIHSATGGVQVSRLAPDDPASRHWWDRWVGARRVLDES